MKLELLLSTMNLKNEEENRELIKKMNVTINSLTINQITDENIIESNDLKCPNRLISVRDKGLSKSRNMAISNSESDICIIADDDVIYKDNFQDIIYKEYDKNNKYDVICFFVESSNNERKIKRMISSKVGRLRAMRIRSVEITFRKKSIIDNNIKFKENFGAGTCCDRGEETIFLWECIKKGLKIKFVNKKIADVSYKESTWFKGFNEAFFVMQGQVFYELSNDFSHFLILQFAIRKYHIYRKKFSLFQVIKLMNSQIPVVKRKNTK